MKKKEEKKMVRLEGGVRRVSCVYFFHFLFANDYDEKRVLIYFVRRLFSSSIYNDGNHQPSAAQQMAMCRLPTLHLTF